MQEKNDKENKKSFNIKMSLEEKAWYFEIEAIYEKINFLVNNDMGNYSTFMLNDCGDICHKLHQSLLGRGIKVEHKKHMIENRRSLPESPHFYHNIDAIRYLLEFPLIKITGEVK